MSKFIRQLVALFVVPSLLAQSVPTQQRTVTVKKKSVLRYVTLQPLDSRTAKIGDAIPVRLDRPLIVDGTTVMAAGELESGTVKKVVRAGPKGRDGFVEWKLEKIHFGDGSAAKAWVWLTYPPTWRGPVPEQYVEPGDDISNGEAIGMFAAIIVASPFLLGQWLFNKATGRDHQNEPIQPGTEYQLPASSVVVIAIKSNHKVQVQP